MGLELEIQVVVGCLQGVLTTEQGSSARVTLTHGAFSPAPDKGSLINHSFSDTSWRNRCLSSKNNLNIFLLFVQ